MLASWVCQYRAHGRSRRALIGSAQALGTEQARSQAKKLLGAVALGRDPQAEKAAGRQRNGHSLKAVVADYLAVKQSVLRPASFRVTKLYLTGKAYFGPLHGMAIGEITRADVAARLLAITRNSGTVTGSRARSALSTLFAWAMGEALCEANPVVGTNKPPDSTPRDRVLSDTELVAIWTACKDDDYGRIVRLLALTGARRAEIAGMCWSEVDLDKGFWSLPKERAKNKRALVLPLPPSSTSSRRSHAWPSAISCLATAPQAASRSGTTASRRSTRGSREGLGTGGCTICGAPPPPAWPTSACSRT